MAILDEWVILVELQQGHKAMINKQQLAHQIQALLDSAIHRHTSQGIKVYEEGLKKLNTISSQNELHNLLIRVNKALSGIEAHGYFTDDEFKIVEELRAQVVE